MRWLPLLSVVPHSEEECICIAVSHPSRLYVTSDKIITHNTTVTEPAASALGGAAPSFSDQLRASGRNPDKIPVDTLRAMDSARNGDAAAFAGLTPLHKKAVVATVVRAQDATAAAALGIDPGELNNVDAYSLPQTATDAPALAPEAVTARLTARAATTATVVNDPALPWEGRLTPEGRIELNAAMLTSEADVDRVFDHEVAHLAERDPGTADDFAAMRSAIAPEVLTKLEGALRSYGYGTTALPSEVAANLAQSLNAQFQTLPAWKRLLQRLKTWAKQKLGLTLNDADAQVIAARLIARGMAMAPAAGAESFSLPQGAQTQRVPSITDEIQAGWNLTKANQDERTIDGTPVEPLAYRVRSNADLTEQAHRWLDAFAAQNDETPAAELGTILTESLKNNVDPMTGQSLSDDVAAVILVTLGDRLPDFDLSRGQWDAARQHNASKAGFSLQFHKVYDPLTKIIERGTQQTGTVYTETTGGKIDEDFVKMKDRVIAAQEKEIAELGMEIASIETLFDDAVTKQDAMADDAKEAGRKAGERAGRKKGRDEAVKTFREWLKGGDVDGLPSFLQVARRYLQLSRFDSDKFTAALTKLFPTIPAAEFEAAAAKIAEMIANKTAAARRREIQAFIDELAGKKKAAAHGEKLGKFLNTILRAEKFGVLDQDTFLAAFAHAFNVNGMTAANLAQLRDLWHEIQRRDEKGRLIWRDIARERLEQKFTTAVNAIAPAARWDNFLFDQFQSGILSSVGSIVNQFSGLFRVLTGLDAVQKSVARKDYGAFLSEWWKNSSSVFKNLPLVLDAVRGEALGHLPAEVRGNFAPREQKLQSAVDGQTMRIELPNGEVFSLGDGIRKALRLKELWSWRLIRGAEGVSGITDAQANYRAALVSHYREQGLKPAQARQKANADLLASPADRETAFKQATEERRMGIIGDTDGQVRLRTQYLIQRQIEERLDTDLTQRVELITAYQQFKTPPLGLLGSSVSRLMGKLSKPEGPTRITRFFFLFGKFLGHAIDTTLAYTPGLHYMTKALDGDSQRHKLIKEIFGSVEAYNQEQAGKAAAGAAFMAMTGALMAMAQAMADDDEEPFFVVTGTAPMADRGDIDKLKATGKWEAGVLKIFGVTINYQQIPELAAPLSALGNMSDYALHAQTLYPAKRKGVVDPWKATGSGTWDLMLAPVKRSTYRQWYEFMTAALKGDESSMGTAGEKFSNILSSPLGGFLRVPLVVDADKIMREETAKDAKGLAENFLRRVPFVHVGETMYNAYGEKQPSFGLISLTPQLRITSDGKPSPEVKRAALLNVETNTSRGFPKDPEFEDANGEIIELTREQRETFVREAGRYFVESLLRNEEDIRRAYQDGGAAAAQKIVSNISSKANAEAKKGLQD